MRRDTRRYVKSIIHNYWKGYVLDNEVRAVERAIEITESLPDGKDRMTAVRLYLMKRSHTQDGVALIIPTSKGSVARWADDFVEEVAKNYKCDRLV